MTPMEVRMRAERRAGELLKETALAGQRDAGNGGNRKSRSLASTVKLEDLGISKDQSSRWQKLAEIPYIVINVARSFGKYFVYFAFLVLDIG